MKAKFIKRAESKEKIICPADPKFKGVNWLSVCDQCKNFKLVKRTDGAGWVCSAGVNVLELNARLFFKSVGKKF